MKSSMKKRKNEWRYLKERMLPTNRRKIKSKYRLCHPNPKGGILFFFFFFFSLQGIYMIPMLDKQHKCGSKAKTIYIEKLKGKK